MFTTNDVGFSGIELGRLRLEAAPINRLRYGRTCQYIVNLEQVTAED
jgi:hypothetical protein